jgi:hypothetical protein
MKKVIERLSNRPGIILVFKSFLKFEKGKSKEI